MPSIPVAKIETFISREDSRYTLKFAWFDVEGKRLLATDGHRAMRVSVEPFEGETTGAFPIEAFELARKELKAISKATEKGTIPDPWLKVFCSPSEITIENLLTNTKHIVIRPKLEDGRPFPNIDAVVPKVKGACSVSLSTALLSDICKSIDGQISIGLWISPNEDSKQPSDKAVVLASQDGKAIAILMPTRGTDIRGEDLTKRGAGK